MENYTCDPPVDLTSLNMSAYEYPWSKTDVFIRIDLTSVCKICLYLFVSIFAVFGNVIIIVIVFTNKHMRLTTNYYLVNLAIADILIAAFCMSIHLIKELSSHSYILGTLVCKTDASFKLFTRREKVTCGVKRNACVGRTIVKERNNFLWLMKLQMPTEKGNSSSDGK
ncbi:Cholecystokinin receptor type A [Nymphon striatum]|nr:Cholecystokinin receptor type A [Nymphon striatum]